MTKRLLRRCCGFALWLLAVAASAVPSLALDPGKQIGQYGHDSWTSQNGLPGEAVYQILQSRDGYLWLRTGTGLARFDGVRFVAMDAAIGGETVRAIAMSAGGELLIRTATRTVLYRDGEFSDYIKPAGLPDGGIRVLFESREHLRLIGSDDFVYRLDPAGPAMLRRGTSWINTILEDDSGKIWIGGDRSLFTYKDGKLSEPFDMSRYGPVTDALLEDRQHRIWAGTSKGLYQLSGDLPKPNLVSQPAVPGHIAALLDDRQGNLWIGTEDAGVQRLTNGRISSMDSIGGLTDSNVLSLFEDREGSLWIGTSSGLDRLRNTKLTTYGVKEGLPANYAKSALASRDGGVYVFTQTGGLSRIQLSQTQGDTVSPFVLNAQLPKLYADAQFESKDGSLWMGTDNGLTQFKDGQLTVYPGRLDDEATAARAGLKIDVDHFVKHHISAFAEDAEGLIVTTSECVAFRFRDGRTLPFTLRGQQTPLSSPAGIYTFTIYAEPSGTLWFGTSNGLLKLVPGKAAEIVPLSQTTFGVTDIYDDRKGNLWLGGRTPGLVRLHTADGRVTHYTAKQGLFDSYIAHILPDSDGKLWMSSQDGIYAVQRQELEDVAEGRAQIVSAHRYGLPDGLKTTQASDQPSQPSGARSADGRLWFTTFKGVVVVDPRHLIHNDLPPPVLLESVVTDGKVHPGSRESTIEPGMKSIEFHYTALSMNVPERVRFRYQLEGYDHGWVEAGGRRVAYYTNLPPGRYRFRVIAANDDGVWNEQGASAALVLKPYVYQTWWFLSLCGVWAICAGVAANRRHTRRIRTRAEELSRLVEERTAELQESQQELRQLAHFDTLTALPNRRMFTEDFSNMQAMMQRSGFSLLLIDFDRFKQINDTYGHDAGDAFLIEAATRLRAAVRTSDRVARLGGDEFAILLAGDHDEMSLKNACDRIIRSFANAIEFRGANIVTSASVGVAVFPDDGKTQEELYKSADLALYEAKRSGRDNWRRYSPALTQEPGAGVHQERSPLQGKRDGVAAA